MSTRVPFFRPTLGDEEVDEVVSTLRSGWLTTGPRVRAFEERFAQATGGRYALAVNSCTAALHLAVEALGLKPTDAVLVPTMTFAATAEVIRYTGATPILVDCDPVTLNMDVADADRKIDQLISGRLSRVHSGERRAVGVIPVHVGGAMLDIQAVTALALRHQMWMVDDAAHAFPAAWRKDQSTPWQRCGEGTAAVSCFSFYANKTITTGEGGMAVTDDEALASRMRMMALHGLSTDAWDRYSGKGTWDYRILAPGFKYNMTDVAAAIGIHQLARAEELRLRRAAVAARYLREFADVEEIELPLDLPDRVHSWHLFPIRLRLDRLAIGRDDFIRELGRAGIGTSVHWRPLHLHPYYQDRCGWRDEDCPRATAAWGRLVSLPIFASMSDAEVSAVVEAVRSICLVSRRRASVAMTFEAGV